MSDVRGRVGRVGNSASRGGESSRAGGHGRGVGERPLAVTLAAPGLCAWKRLPLIALAWLATVTRSMQFATSKPPLALRSTMAMPTTGARLAMSMQRYAGRCRPRKQSDRMCGIALSRLYVARRDLPVAHQPGQRTALGTGDEFRGHHVDRPGACRSFDRRLDVAVNDGPSTPRCDVTGRLPARDYQLPRSDAPSVILLSCG